TYSTFTNPTPVAFTKPTEVPSIFSFGSARDCASNSIAPSASALPSIYPIDRPAGLEAGCVISNAAEVNDHAFWDLYACCKSGDMTASGSPYTCTAQCKAGNGQTWQELGECLSKRVEVVVCKPQFNEIARNQTDSSASRSSTSGAQSTRSGSSAPAASGSSGGAAPSNATGAASTMGVVHTTSSKLGAAVFVVLAIGSAAGMLL
ncbi:hypothetical protein BKA66DRAFT_398822, partial [Pyrenochaeta sp. MPI-SDFR-AT-0127]